MRSRFSASAISSSSASPRVPTSEKRLQQVAVGEVLARGHELALVAARALVVEPAPRRVELQERVLDEVPRAHGADYRIASAAGAPTTAVGG